MHYKKLFVFLSFLLMQVAQAETEITLTKDYIKGLGEIYIASFPQPAEPAVLEFRDAFGEKILGLDIPVGAGGNSLSVRKISDGEVRIILPMFPNKATNMIRVPLHEVYIIADLTMTLVLEGLNSTEEISAEITIPPDTTPEVPTDPLPEVPMNSPFQTFNTFVNRYDSSIREVLAREVVPTSTACSDDYADSRTRPYECMRSLIPGVQQMHNLLALLREANVRWITPMNTTSTYVTIIDRFTRRPNESTSHGEYVSRAFESIAANQRTTCERENEFFRSLYHCYNNVPTGGQANLSLSEIDFDQRDSVPPDISKDEIISKGVRLGVATANTPYNSNPQAQISTPTFGPRQNGLGAVMDTGDVTLVGGWHNREFVFAITRPTHQTLTGITEEQEMLLASRLSAGSRSCEKEGGDPATAKWCVLFPHRFYFFENGDRMHRDGTSGAVALYNGAIDLLRTIFPFLTNQDADAVIRSCAKDMTQAGIYIADSFPDYVALLKQVGTYEIIKTFYGTDGIDSVTGVGKGDLSCLINTDGSLVSDPRTLIDPSLL